MKKLMVLLMLCAWILDCTAQDSTSVNLKKLTWLEGTWEGTGFRSQSTTSRDMKLTFDKTSQNIVITVAGETAFHERLNPDSEYTNFDLAPNGTFGIEAYFLGEMKWENRLLMVTPVSQDHFNLYVVYNRRQKNDAFILQGVFKKKNEAHK